MGRFMKKILLFVIIAMNQRTLALDGQQKLLTIGGAYVFSQDSYKLEGTGFSTNSGSPQGKGAAAEIRWNRADGRISFLYLNTSVEESSPSSISPADTKAGLRRYLLSYQSGAGEGYGGSIEGWKTEYGLEIRQRWADTTAPNQYISAHDSTGVHFGLGRTFTVGSKTSFETGVGLYVPLYMDERTSKTGYYKFSINPDVKATLVQEIADYLSVTVGVSLLYEKIYYSGTGQRGTSGANETFMDINFPMELRFQF